MTTATKKPGAKKTAASRLPLPVSAEKATIGGTEYVIIPSADFEDWYIDQMLAAVASERLKTERHKAVPWDEVVARLQKGKSVKAGGK
jgi:hypothetical protein